MLPLFILVLSVVGFVAIALVLLDGLWSPLQTLKAVLQPYFQPNEVQTLQQKFGPWAVVTGSTDGIGKQYALELARQGLSVVLISRNPQRLRDTALEIERTHSVKTKVIQADFSEGPPVYDHIREELKDLPIGILVNNVGCQYEYPMPLHELGERDAWRLIAVNAGAVTLMSRLVLPGLLARGRGAVVNVSSGAELQPLPLMAVYAATKAYVGSFTAAVREEVRLQNITVQHVSPLFVSTKMNAFSQKLLEGNMFVPDAATYARHAVATLGRTDHTTGYWIHGIQYFFMKIPPVWVTTKIGGVMNARFRREYIENKAKSS